jgi:type IV secretion system protein VirB10
MFASAASGEIVLAEGTRIFLALNDPLSTKHSSEGDIFTADVVVPVYHKERLVLPKGSIVAGSISRIVRPGRFRGKALLNVLFQSVRIAGRLQLPLVASLATVEPGGNVKAESTIEGEGSKGKDAAQVAKPALAGAGIGALAGGGTGAAIGSAAGAVIGLGSVFASRGKDVEIRKGSTLEIVLDRPLTIPDR